MTKLHSETLAIASFEVRPQLQETPSGIEGKKGRKKPNQQNTKGKKNPLAMISNLLTERKQ